MKRSVRYVKITIGAEGWRQELINACRHEASEVKMIYARPFPESEEYGEEVEVWETIDYVDWQDFLERNYSEIYGVVLSETTERIFEP